MMKEVTSTRKRTQVVLGWPLAGVDNCVFEMLCPRNAGYTRREKAAPSGPTPLHCACRHRRTKVWAPGLEIGRPIHGGRQVLYLGEGFIVRDENSSGGDGMSNNHHVHAAEAHAVLF
jgi:hypothetical protein